MPTFATDVVDAVLAHMNNDHLDDNILISRAFGDPDAAAASMTTLDEHGGTWQYTVVDELRTLTVAWSTRIAERAEIRREIVVLYDAACARLGITPRPH